MYIHTHTICSLFLLLSSIIYGQSVLGCLEKTPLLFAWEEEISKLAAVFTTHAVIGCMMNTLSTLDHKA